MSVSDKCKMIGAHTLRLVGEVYTMSRAIDFHHVADVRLGIKYASDSMEDFRKAGILTDEQIKEYTGVFEKIIDDMAFQRMPAASSKANRLVDDIGWLMLNKLVECEKGLK